MYYAVADPYCYPDTQILINKLGLRDAAKLEAFETEISFQRASEPLPLGEFDDVHYRALHHHLFQDVYAWAGQFRTVRIAKQNTMFCYPENIAGEMAKLFAELRASHYLRGLTPSIFASRSAHVLSELNAIHPFREGNGRTQLTFLIVLAEQAGHALNLNRMDPRRILQAMIVSFGGSEHPLADVIAELMA